MKNIARKNQIVITALAIMIAVAGYLNYGGKGGEDADETGARVGDPVAEQGDVSDLSDEDLYAKAQGVISGTTITTGESISEKDATGEALDANATGEVTGQEEGNVPGEAVLANSGVARIADLKLTREQTRSKNKEALLAIVENDTLPEEQKKGAVDEMVRLTDVAEKEAAAEIMLEAKGFPDVVVNMDEDTVDVIVNAGELTDGERAQIEDMVKRKTGMPGEKIVITTLSRK